MQQSNREMRTLDHSGSAGPAYGVLVAGRPRRDELGRRRRPLLGRALGRHRVSARPERAARLAGRTRDRRARRRAGRAAVSSRRRRVALGAARQPDRCRRRCARAAGDGEPRRHPFTVRRSRAARCGSRTRQAASSSASASGSRLPGWRPSRRFRSRRAGLRQSVQRRRSSPGSWTRYRRVRCCRTLAQAGPVAAHRGAARSRAAAA